MQIINRLLAVQKILMQPLDLFVRNSQLRLLFALLDVNLKGTSSVSAINKPYCGEEVASLDFHDKFHETAVLITHRVETVEHPIGNAHAHGRRVAISVERAKHSNLIVGYRLDVHSEEFKNCQELFLVAGNPEGYAFPELEISTPSKRHALPFPTNTPYTDTVMLNSPVE